MEPFPLLGDAFVSATVAQVKRLAKQPLALADGQAFLSLKETPEFFRWYIERYLLYQGQGPELALQHTLARVHDDSGHAKAWKAMNRSRSRGPCCSPRAACRTSTAPPR